jgi:hypothetical protein
MNVHLKQDDINNIEKKLLNNDLNNFKVTILLSNTNHKNYLFKYTNIIDVLIDIVIEYLIEEKEIKLTYLKTNYGGIISKTLYLKNMDHSITINSIIYNNRYVTKNDVHFFGSDMLIYKLISSTNDEIKNDKYIDDIIEKISTKQLTQFEYIINVPVSLLNSFLSTNKKINGYSIHESHIEFGSQYFSKCYVTEGKGDFLISSIGYYLLIIKNEIEFEKITNIIEFFANLLNN